MAVAADFIRLKRRRQLPDVPPRYFQMTVSELKFVDEVFRWKPNLQVFRTPNGYGLGDFVVLDLSNDKAIVGWVVELKANPHASPGNQLRAASQAALHFGLHRHKALADTCDNLIREFRKGRSKF